MGNLKDLFLVNNKKLSFFASVLSGESLVFQSGINSSRAFVSKTAPDNICAPTSEPFSTIPIFSSLLFFFASWASLMLLESPDGPAPIIKTSKLIY